MSKVTDYLKLKFSPDGNKPTKAKQRRKQSRFDRLLHKDSVAGKMYPAHLHHIVAEVKPCPERTEFITRKKKEDPYRPGWAKKRDRRRLERLGGVR
jgi:hypothetical protein